MNPEISFTPLSGSSGKSGGYCGLLEMGDSAVLLDCGTTATHLSLNAVDQKIRETLAAELEGLLSQLEAHSSRISAVLLSHGDFAHMGALPLLVRRLGRPLRIICTQPALKMAQMALYDICIGLGQHRPEEASANESTSDERFLLTLDDIDMCFSDVQLVKYHQQATIHVDGGEEIQICAVNAGRTVGGAAWQLVRGVANVFYAVGLNLKKETVLDGADISVFPPSPSLLITDSDVPISASSTRKKKESKSGQEALVTAVKEFIRSGSGGDILIPCESGGRALELIQLLIRNVMRDKGRLETDMLVYLSPMSENILDFARAQLEWMSDSLCKDFYKGGQNPFDFSEDLLKCVSSMAEFNRLGPGVKIVLATDTSLSTGFAKDLLMRWGGDTRCKVIFTGDAEPHSLAAEIFAQIGTQPVIVSVVKTEKELLVGEELRLHQAAIELEKKSREDEALQKKRELELAMFVPEVAGDEEDDEDEQDIENESSMLLDSRGASDSSTGTPVIDRNSSLDSRSSTGGKRQKTAPPLEGYAKFAKPRYLQFESRNRFTDSISTHNMDIGMYLNSLEYGIGIDDLDLPESVVPVVRKPSKFSADKMTNAVTLNDLPTTLSSGSADSSQNATVKQQKAAVVEPPNGKADLKAIKRVVSVVNPKKLVVYRGPNETDFLGILKHAKNNGHVALAPVDREKVSFVPYGSIAKIVLPSGIPSISGTKQIRESGCILRVIRGAVSELDNCHVGNDKSGRQFSLAPVPYTEYGASSSVSDAQCGPILTEPLYLSSLDHTFRAQLKQLGRVSFNEVSLNTVKTQLSQRKSMGAVEYRIGSGGNTGATVICGGQVVLYKANENDFVLEGAPGTVFNETRNNLYSNFFYL